mmetsp:Transcript_13604/g.22704  ORF Transcript_13604/g.22704 Transcript_13604/m.22704 type:complete len:321 (-) Transcript_13604:161-1123(-)
MEWQQLNLAKASVLKREVDVALQRLGDAATDPTIDRQSLVNSIQLQIQELESFCMVHNDDDRAILFEKERLRLRQAMQSHTLSTTSPRDGRSIASGADKSSGVHSGSKGGGSTKNPRSPGKSKPKSNRSENASLASSGRANKSVASVGSGSVSQRSLGGGGNAIYDWEGTGAPAPRVAIELNGTVFVPSSINGFYNRQDSRSPLLDSTPLPEKHCDFQIILSEEELITLAARKKAAATLANANRTKIDMSGGSGAGGMAAGGVAVGGGSRTGSGGNSVSGLMQTRPHRTLHSSTPYVEPSRIQRDMLRPTNPDKWLGNKY